MMLALYGTFSLACGILMVIAGMDRRRGMRRRSYDN